MLKPNKCRRRKMEKKLKISTKKQLERLVEEMEQQPELARGKGQIGSSKKHIQEMWEQIALSLNALGPPTRTGHEWQRVWVHYKANLKRKLSKNKGTLLATGGDPYQEVILSATEERVYSLTQGNGFVNPIEESIGVYDSVEEIEEIILPSIPASITQASKPTPPHCKCKNEDFEEERNDILKEQLELQKKALEIKKEKVSTLKELEKTVHKGYQVLKKQTEIMEYEHSQKCELREVKLKIAKAKLQKLTSELNDY